MNAERKKISVNGANGSMSISSYYEKKRVEILLDAVQFGMEEAVIGALKDIGDPNKQDRFGNSAIIIASEHGNTDIVKILLECSSNPNLVNTFGDTALTLALRKEYFDIASILIENGADIHLKTRFFSARHIIEGLKNKELSKSMLAQTT